MPVCQSAIPYCDAGLTSLTHCVPSPPPGTVCAFCHANRLQRGQVRTHGAGYGCSIRGWVLGAESPWVLIMLTSYNFPAPSPSLRAMGVQLATRSPTRSPAVMNQHIAAATQSCSGLCNCFPASLHPYTSQGHGCAPCQAAPHTCLH